jgi:hypothetical protein
MFEIIGALCEKIRLGAAMIEDNTLEMRGRIAAPCPPARACRWQRRQSAKRFRRQADELRQWRL